MLHAILSHSYFSFDQSFYKPDKGVARGPHISGLIAEIFLQHFENLAIKHLIDHGSLIHYTRYVGDILIIFNHEKISNEEILVKVIHSHKNLEFEITPQENNKIDFLDLESASNE